MKLVVLAAGMGRRLTVPGAGGPKVLLTLPDGRSLLEHHVLAASQEPGLDRVIIVCGHGADEVERAAAQIDGLVPISPVYSPFYQATGPVVSVWVARTETANSDFLLCNGDTYYSPAAFGRLLREPQDGISLAVAHQGTSLAGDMRVTLSSAGTIARVGQDLTEGEADGVSTGMLLVRGDEARTRILAEVDRLLRSGVGLRPTTPWHTIVDSLAGAGVPIRPVWLQAQDWHEIDTPEDLVAIASKLGKGRPIGAAFRR